MHFLFENSAEKPAEPSEPIDHSNLVFAPHLEHVSHRPSTHLKEFKMYCAKLKTNRVLLTRGIHPPLKDTLLENLTDDAIA